MNEIRIKIPLELRNGKLPRALQARRDRMIGRLYLWGGASMEQLEVAFMVSRPTVSAAIGRHNARISPREAALRRWRRHHARLDETPNL